MNTESNNRKELIKHIEEMDSSTLQLMLAFAAGYEANKSAQPSNPPATREKENSCT